MIDCIRRSPVVLPSSGLSFFADAPFVSPLQIISVSFFLRFAPLDCQIVFVITDLFFSLRFWL